MKKLLLLPLICLFVFASCTKDTLGDIPQDQGQPAVDPGNNNPLPEDEVVKGWMRVKFKPAQNEIVPALTRSGVRTGIENIDKAITSLNITEMKRVFPHAGQFEERTRKEGLHLWYDVLFDETIPMTRAVTDLTQLPEIDIAEPVYKIESVGRTSPMVAARAQYPIVQYASAPFDDPYLGDQWHYHNTGTLPNSIAGADINLFRAWEIEQGSPSVIVAVVDGGIDHNHEDLAGNVGNLAELNGQPGVDDDNNGYIDDFYGWNFVFDNNEIETDDHGTHVAGTIAAENNNGIGVCGIAGGHGGHTGVRVLSCQTFGTRNGIEVSADSPATIKYGADAGAVISQNSWGYRRIITELPESTKEAIDYFIKYAGMDKSGNQVGPMKGGIVIFAAGNDNADFPTYPASYEKVLSVSAIAPDYERSYYSNFADWIDIAAPGGTYTRGEKYSNECAVLSTIRNNEYAYMQGTSMACPHVSGVAALVVSKYGGPEFTPEKLRAHLEYRTRDINSFNPLYINKLGRGYLDAYMALGDDQGMPPGKVSELRCANTVGEVAVSWEITPDADDGTAAYYNLYWGKSPLESINPDNLPVGTSKTLVQGGHKAAGETISYTLKDIYGETGYYVAIIAVDPWGNSSEATYASFVTPKNYPPVITRMDSEAIKLRYYQKHQIRFQITEPEGHKYTYTVDDPSKSVKSSVEGDYIVFDFYNYKCPSGSHTLRLTVSDILNASSSVDVPIELEENKVPVLVTPFEDVYINSLEDSKTIAFKNNFDDENTGKLGYEIKYDTEALNLQSVSGEFTIKPLKYGQTEISVVARDEDGLACEAVIKVNVSYKANNEVDLFPNPVKDKLTIRVGEGFSGEARIKIHNSAGRLVWDKSVTLSQFELTTIDLSSLSAGNYVMSVETPQKKVTRSIVKL